MSIVRVVTWWQLLEPTIKQSFSALVVHNGSTVNFTLKHCDFAFSNSEPSDPRYIAPWSSRDKWQHRGQPVVLQKDLGELQHHHKPRE